MPVPDGPIRVLLEIHAPPEAARRLAILAEESPDVTLATEGGSFPARIAGDDALLLAAAATGPRYLGEDTGPGSRAGTVIYWLRAAADMAWRHRHGR